MNILIADDEVLSLELLEDIVRQVMPNADIYTVRKSSEVVPLARKVKIDIAFLDIEMRGQNGIELADELRRIKSNTNIVFVTGYKKYIHDAFTARASGYIMKPVTKEDVVKEMKDLRYPVNTTKNIRIHTFGNFEVFVNEIPVFFGRTRSKEILAFLVDRRGASVSKKEIASTLWEDDDYDRTRQKYIQTLTSEMMKSLYAIGIDDIIIKNYNSMAIDTTKVDCDYFKFWNNDKEALKAYSGEYMVNYSWAEYTNGVLMQHKDSGY